MIFDYEHATALGMVHPKYVLVPEVIPDSAIAFHSSHIRKYPGIKEDVYVPNFKQDDRIRRRAARHTCRCHHSGLGAVYVVHLPALVRQHRSIAVARGLIEPLRVFGLC